MLLVVAAGRVGLCRRGHTGHTAVEVGLGPHHKIILTTILTTILTAILTTIPHHNHGCGA